VPLGPGAARVGRGPASLSGEGGGRRHTRCDEGPRPAQPPNARRGRAVRHDHRRQVLHVPPDGRGDDGRRLRGARDPASVPHRGRAAAGFGEPSLLLARCPRGAARGIAAYRPAHLRVRVRDPQRPRDRPSAAGDHQPGRHPAVAAPGHGAMPGRLLHLPGNRHPARSPEDPGSGRQPRPPRFRPGTVEGRPTGPVRRPAPADPAGRLDLPGGAGRGAPARRRVTKRQAREGDDMRSDAVVVGAGLSGLVAALRLAEAGLKTTVVAQGVGSTHLSPASIDVLGYAPDLVESPARALPAFLAEHPEHPYARISLELIEQSVAWLRERAEGLGYTGSLRENLLVPTAAGVPAPTAVVPASMAAGDLRSGGRFAFVGLRAMKSFHPAYLAENLVQAKLPSGAAVEARAVL